MSSESTIDVVDGLVESSTPIVDEINIQKNDQESQKIKIESIAGSLNVSSFSES